MAGEGAQPGISQRFSDAQRRRNSLGEVGDADRDLWGGSAAAGGVEGTAGLLLSLSDPRALDNEN